MPAKLGRVEAEFLSDPTAMLTINDMTITDTELAHSNVTLMQNAARAGLGNTAFAFGYGLAIRRPLLSVLLPFPPVMPPGHDLWISEIATTLGVKRVIAEPLQLYRRHGRNESQAFFSIPDRLGVLAVLGQFQLSSPLSGWDLHFDMIAGTRTLLEQRRQDIEAIGLGPNLAHGFAILDRRETVIRTRVALLQKSRRKRLFGVLSFWRAGHYRNFSGWKRALKDLIRP